MKINYKEFVSKFDEIVARGFSCGLGVRGGQMCVEAAVCAALDLPHGDYPECVEPAVRLFKVKLNDSNWTTRRARAEGLRDLGIAQVGSKGVVDGMEFARRVEERTIREIIPALLREGFPNNDKYLKAAARCEAEGTAEAFRGAGLILRRRRPDTAGVACSAWIAIILADPAVRVAPIGCRATKGDKYLLMSARIALDVLRELGSPGVNYV